MSDASASGGGRGGSGGYDCIKEQDRFLPIVLHPPSRVLRVEKEQSKSVKANDKCQREKRKTSNVDDLLWAMEMLGFEEYIEPLKVYLEDYTEVRAQLVMWAFFLIKLGMDYWTCFYWLVPAVWQ
ncbi:hypothetical protein ZWY2020_013504 [Hordeum vulgare]|nr:hypothetical protein ZWY2020_013504 [Hordeum vulgare]